MIDDNTPEPTPETFYVNLSNPSGGATISDGQGVGTIQDDEIEDPCWPTGICN